MVTHDVTQNRRAAWNFANEQGNHTIPQPVLSILATKVRFQSRLIDRLGFADVSQDPVADMEVAAKLLHSFDFLPDHTLHVRTVWTSGPYILTMFA